VHCRPGAKELPHPLLQRLILAGTTGGAPLTTHRGATTATCRTAACRDTSVAMTTSGATQTAEPGDDHAAGLVALCTGAMSTSSNVGIIANNAILVAWFTQRGSQPAAGIMSSVEGWSIVSAFKLAASSVSHRLDQVLRSSRMISFTPVHIPAGWWDWSWRGARRFNRKSCSTISEVSPFSARYWIQSSTGSKPGSRTGSFPHSVQSRVRPPTGSANRSWASTCTSAQSSLHRSHLPGEMCAM
jgi:hypothetical protein